MTDLEHLVDLVAKSAAEEAIHQYKKAEEDAKKGRHKRKLHNTRLILKNYNLLKIHNDSSIAELADIVDDEAFDLISAMLNKPDAEEIKIKSIKQSVVRTRIILDHIDTMLEAYRRRCVKSNREMEKRRWEVIARMYLYEDGRMSADEIANEFRLDTRTIYRDVDMACEDLSTLLFGVDWM